MIHNISRYLALHNFNIFQSDIFFMNYSSDKICIDEKKMFLMSWQTQIQDPYVKSLVYSINHIYFAKNIYVSNSFVN